MSSYVVITDVDQGPYWLRAADTDGKMFWIGHLQQQPPPPELPTGAQVYESDALSGAAHMESVLDDLGLDIINLEGE